MEVPSAMASFFPQSSQVGHSFCSCGVSDGQAGEEEGAGKEEEEEG